MRKRGLHWIYFDFKLFDATVRHLKFDTVTNFADVMQTRSIAEITVWYQAVKEAQGDRSRVWLLVYTEVGQASEEEEEEEGKAAEGGMRREWWIERQVQTS